MRCNVAIYLYLGLKGISSILGYCPCISLTPLIAPTFFLLQSSMATSKGSLRSLHNIAALIPIFLLVKSSFTTCSFPSVSVPVLSAQITETEPRVSAAKSLRTKAFRFNIRCMPKAKITVKVITRPSGIEATATATLVVNIVTKSFPSKAPKEKMRKEKTPTKTAKIFAKEAICS